jgi:hypothetical protein
MIQMSRYTAAVRPVHMDVQYALWLSWKPVILANERHLVDRQYVNKALRYGSIQGLIIQQMLAFASRSAVDELDRYLYSLS